MEITQEDGKIVILPKKQTLDQMLEMEAKENIHIFLEKISLCVPLSTTLALSIKTIL